MPAFFRYQQWDRQPDRPVSVNPAHPLASGLVQSYICNTTSMFGAIAGNNRGSLTNTSVVAAQHLRGQGTLAFSPTARTAGNGATTTASCAALGTGAQTKEIWVWLNNADTSPDGLLSIGGANQDNIYANVTTNGGVYWGLPGYAITAATSTTANAWHHIVCVYLGASGLSNYKIYVNGVSRTVGSVGTVGAINNPAGTTRLCNDQNGNAYGLRGNLACANVWANRALTADEVLRRYLESPWALYY